MIAPSGERYWGRFGAAGLLAVDAERGVLLQHRVGWSHHGGTWALPGGARHEGESAGSAAMREAAEEAAVPPSSIRQRLWSVFDRDVWTYTTVVADVVEPFEPVINDPESVALEWVPVDEIDQRPLHPGFASSWERLRPLLAVRPSVVVDGANVVGSLADGWWRDRAGATSRLLERVGSWVRDGVVAEKLVLPETRWFPDVSVVLEGRARGADTEGLDAVQIVAAQAVGDDAIVDEAARRVGAGEQVTVVTSDRGLRTRVTRVGARVEGARWLLSQLDP